MSHYTSSNLFYSPVTNLYNYNHYRDNTCINTLPLVWVLFIINIFGNALLIIFNSESCMDLLHRWIIQVSTLFDFDVKVLAYHGYNVLWITGVIFHTGSLIYGFQWQHTQKVISWLNFPILTQ